MAADTELPRTRGQPRPELNTSLNVGRALRQLRDQRAEPSHRGQEARLQSEVTREMRERVAEWLLAVCEEEKAEPQVFCLAAQCLDAALDTILIKGPQLQLLAAACLLVSWKVRECRPISALKIVKYTNFSVQLKTLLVSPGQPITAVLCNRATNEKTSREAVCLWSRSYIDEN